MRRFIIAILVGVLSLGLMGASLMRRFPVYEEDVGEDAFVFFEEVSELTLVDDATFAGVIRSTRTGRLITTYDRSQPKSRPACPT